MITVTLPDNSKKSLEKGKTPLDVAASIGAGLAKASLLAKVNGELWDINRPLEQDCNLSLITAKNDEILEVLRHDAAHVLAMAVKELFDDALVTFGPATESGFYYDFHRKTAFSPEDLPVIEQRMREIVKRDVPIIREVWKRDSAVNYFKEIGEKFKAEWIEQLPKDEDITVYKQGDWLDLCRGPHLASTGRLGTSFSLETVSGAYWRGDANNEPLQRIRGTCWRNDKELKAYFLRKEEALKRDHRKLGRELDLFHIQEEAAGSVFWHPNGWTLYRLVENHVRARIEQDEYEEVKTPQLIDRDLWERSGHWDKYRQNMFVAEVEEDGVAPGETSSHRMMALKPMNCPGHVQIFKQALRSYRSLPMRMAEFGSCHRYEPKGALHGLMRVRSFTQDDAHIFCTKEQITAETKKFISLLTTIYKDFGFTDFIINFSDRPKVRAGEDAIWDEAESSLENAAAAAGVQVVNNPGDGAFYGTKLDFVLKDAIGRNWQCGTLQADFVLPKRLGAEYIDENGDKKVPIMMHRAIVGSIERFMGILIEHYEGKFPLWLAPIQVVITTVTNASDDYAQKVYKELQSNGIRSKCDCRNETISFKIREHSKNKIPVIIVVGEKECNENTVTFRRLGSKGQETLALRDAMSMLSKESLSPMEVEKYDK